MITRRSLVSGVAASLAILGTARPARAQAQFPNRPMRLMVGYPPGGGVDLLARLVADPMRERLGQPVVVENRTGAAAMIAAQAVVQANDGGHTLLVAASGEVAVNKHLYKEKMAYDPDKDLVPIALAGIVPCLVVVPVDLPVRTPTELIDYAKSNKGALSFSSSGIGNPQQLAGELMNKMAGTDVQHIPYRGAAPAVADVAAGTVTMSFTSLAAALPLIQGGKIRAVAVTSRERMPQLPDVEPLNVAPGLADYELLNWFAIFAPANAPPAALARITETASEIVRLPQIRKQLDSQGIIARDMSADELKAFVRSESDKFAKIIADANITLTQ